MTSLGTVLNNIGLYNGELRQRKLARAKRSRNTIICEMQKVGNKTMKYAKLRTQLREINEVIRDLE